ncbi:MAG: PD-(D/E)XK nuclease family protein, partial [Clostridiaceae bacterium]|nr:PD-(D/E)XK nuclease family protein [Clostridiaceae bacterium]
MSPSKIDSYNKCAFKFMLENIFSLNLEEEKTEEPSNMQIGDLYHKVLNLYYLELHNFENLEEEKFNKAFEEGLKKSFIKEEGFETEIEEYRSKLINFITMDLKRMKNYEKITGNILRPLIMDSLIEEAENFGIPLTIKVDRIDVEYE